MRAKCILLISHLLLMTIFAGFAFYLFERIMLLSMFVSTFTHIIMDVVVIRCSRQEVLVVRTTFLVCVKVLTLPK